MVNVFLLFVGMIVNDTTAIMLCAPLLMPLLTAYGVNPIHFGALMIVNLSCGCLTPPYASVLYFGMKVGNAKFGEMMKNTLVFLLVGYVPDMLLTTYVEATPSSFLVCWVTHKANDLFDKKQCRQAGPTPACRHYLSSALRLERKLIYEYKCI